MFAHIPFRLMTSLFGVRNPARLRPAPARAQAFPARTPLEALLIDEDFYLAECAVIRPRADVPDREGRRARR